MQLDSSKQMKQQLMVKYLDTFKNPRGGVMACVHRMLLQ
jgi:hypothetical protein